MGDRLVQPSPRIGEWGVGASLKTSQLGHDPKHFQEALATIPADAFRHLRDRFTAVNQPSARI